MAQANAVSIACDTPEYEQIGSLTVRPAGATSNPSLVYAAVTSPGSPYAPLADQAVRFALTNGSSSLEEQVKIALERLSALVGANTFPLVDGQVSVSTDPRIAFDHDRIVDQARNLISHLSSLGIPPSNILIKIPATFQGIRAAQTLEASTDNGIQTNMTLVFSLVQARACAQARLSVISPFVGRVKDWWDVNRPDHPYTTVQSHPGITLVRNIKAMYAVEGSKTRVMAAGFRSVDEIVELVGGHDAPDLVTIPPPMFRQLMEVGVTAPQGQPAVSSSANTDSVYFGDVETPVGEELFLRDMEAEGVGHVKLPEGIEKFSADMTKLEVLLTEKLKPAKPVVPSTKRGWGWKFW